jgi:hypothetical protein
MSDEEWRHWMYNLGEAVYERNKVTKLADELWYEAGMPEDQDYFYDEAEKRLTRRIMGEKGYSGACMTDHEMAKQTAIEQFLRRRKAAIRDGIIDNSSISAGMPMLFYCKYCGILVETLPEDYLFSPRKQCSQCKGLEKMDWLNEARAKAIEEKLYAPEPQKSH